ncbi:MAG: response regulator [Zymomonas sp.]|nr:MAG: response regulator [Zymomonas sp.]
MQLARFTPEIDLAEHVTFVSYSPTGIRAKYIPVTPAPPTQMDEPTAGKTRKFSSVLLVDDSRFLADILTTFFQLDGYTARAAYNGEDAIALVEEQVPDIAFVDIDMPGMTGLDFARHIRSSRRAKGTVLVALSGWDEEEHRQNAAKAGFNHFLSKPVDAPAIREFMKKLGA